MPPTLPRPAVTPSGRVRSSTPSSSSSPAGPPTIRTWPRSRPRVRSARARLAANTASFRRSRIARHSAGLCRRSNGSQPAGPAAASMPAAAGSAGLSRNPRLPSSASNRWLPSSRTHGPRLTQSAAARGTPRVSATATVSRSPAPAATTSPSGAMTSMVPAPTSTTTASGRAPGVVQAPSRAAAGSLSTQRTGQPSRSASTAAWSVPGVSRCSDETRAARPTLPRRAVAVSAAAARSTANRSSRGVSPSGVPSAVTVPTGQPASSAHAARRPIRRPCATTHGSAGPGAASPGGRTSRAQPRGPARSPRCRSRAGRGSRWPRPRPPRRRAAARRPGRRGRSAGSAAGRGGAPPRPAGRRRPPRPRQPGR